MAKIFIDAGHSGDIEPGACRNGLRECDVALKIAKKVNEELLSRGHDTYMYRYGNIDKTSLTHRADMCNSFGADLCVSIHINSAEHPKAQGTEVFYYPGSKVGKELAQEICDYLHELTGFLNRGAKPATFAMLRQTNCPAVYIEVGFISNLEEATYMNDEQGSTVIGVSIANTIDLYIQQD